jgi:hypothetical protein
MSRIQPHPKRRAKTRQGEGGRRTDNVFDLLKLFASAGLITLLKAERHQAKPSMITSELFSPSAQPTVGPQAIQARQADFNARNSSALLRS